MPSAFQHDVFPNHSAKDAAVVWLLVERQRSPFVVSA